MANRFVSGGTISSGDEAGKEGPGPSEAAPVPGKNADEWEAVQKQLEDERQRREEQRRKAATGEEKSLYDILQENKAAKQAAFEEQTKVRNQFRALDDNEVEFLDEVMEKKRREEERVRRETEQGLRAFRERQRDDIKEGEAGEGGEAAESWEVGRKRKRTRERERDVKGVRRRVSKGDATVRDQETTGVGEEKGPSEVADVEEDKGDEAGAQGSTEKSTGKAALGLVDYGSDDSN